MKKKERPEYVNFITGLVVVIVGAAASLFAIAIVAKALYMSFQLGWNLL